MKKPVIEFVDFSFQYRAQAKPTLKNINLTIYEGEKREDSGRKLPEYACGRHHRLSGTGYGRLFSFRAVA